MRPSIQAALLSIGDEVLIGQVINTNASWLSEQLSLAGINVVCHLSVSDKADAICSGIEQLESAADLILVTGGLGPTKDDITKHAIAAHFDDNLVFHQETFDRLEKIMHRFGRKVKPNQRHQCELPSTARILKNNLGTAPGMYFIKKHRHYFFMPGVPFEMKHLFEDRIRPILDDLGMITNHTQTTTLLTAGIGEATLEQAISDIVDDFPEGLSIAYLPGKAQVRLRLTARNLPPATMTSTVEAISHRLGKAVFGENKDSLQRAVGQLLLENRLTVACAESCTGGAVSAMLTEVPGASRYFLGSIISYSNDVKMNLLGVSKSTLERHGAVSKPCVQEMVKGAINALKVDVAVAISGIAGPDGGSEEKPVGTVFIGVGDQETIKVKQLVATKSRDINIAYFSSYALNLLRLFILDKISEQKGEHV